MAEFRDTVPSPRFSTSTTCSCYDRSNSINSQKYRSFVENRMTANFRQYLPNADHPKIIGLTDLDAHAYRARMLENPWIKEWTAVWKESYGRPFVGITTDGSPAPGLFQIA